MTERETLRLLGLTPETVQQWCQRVVGQPVRQAGNLGHDPEPQEVEPVVFVEPKPKKVTYRILRGIETW